MKDATMKPYPGNRSTPRFLSLILLLAAGLALPLPSLAASVALATAPLATSTTSVVQPNLMLLMDDSGSMAWDHLPDDASDGGSAVTWSYGYYGVRSSQCNGVYYNPNENYLPPVHADGTSFSNATFTSAWTNGFNTGAGTVNLNTGFKANQAGLSAPGSDSAQTAYYYNYTGTQTTSLQRNYNSTSNTFFAECHSANGASPGNAVFNKRTLNTAETTTINVSASAAPTATITITGGSSTTVNSVTVAGTTITSGAASGSNNNTTAAGNLAARITLAGYSASNSSSNVVTITGPASAGGLAASQIIVTKAGTDTYTPSAFSNPEVSSITVNGIQLLSGTPNGSGNTSTDAAAIASSINQNSYSATASGSTITITGPASAATYAPVITSSGGVTVTAGAPFPDTDSGHLTNFANWYSYYRTRILMMQTASGRAFGSLNKKYRVGFMKISNSSNPAVPVATFWDNSDTTLGPVSTQRTTWYNSLYASTAGGSTPLRSALSDAGIYYAGLQTGFGAGTSKDPMQYSCQQNFTILTTDGYWNTGTGYMLDSSTPVGNQDAGAGRPMYDGGQADTTVTTTYARNFYSTSSSSCSSGKKRELIQPQQSTCSVTTTGGVAGAPVCSSWSNNGSATYVSPFTSSTSTCTSSTITLPSPNPSAAAVSGTPVTTPGAVGGSFDSLADVAMYYYQTDLRDPSLGNCTGAPVAPATTGSDTCTNNVFMSGLDTNLAQHMNTFTLSLGAQGWMNYSPSYLTDTSGDYVSVKLGLTADSTQSPPVCSWQANGTVCNWPMPGMDSGGNGFIANLDDLWHAAVDGHGAYFSATNPSTLSAGLSSALASVNAKVGSAAAAATSTLNPVAGDNFAYVASYTTVEWTGNLEARGINVDTGVVSVAANWCVQDVAASACASPGTVVADNSGATTVYNCVTPNSTICTGGVLVGTDCQVQVATACTGTMDGMVAATTDTRTIYTANSTGNGLINFDAAYAAANPANFAAAQINTLTQWTSLTAAQQTAAAGVNLVNYLRGQFGHEFNRGSVAAVDQLYRNRSAVLGDALESQPAFIGAPVFNYPYPGYSAYKTAQASRAGTVYMGANDGMLHAFASATGIERWAYVPSMVIPNMWKLADTGYANNLHTNYVNGSVVTTDICTANCTNNATAVWSTILVAGLNGGGRGYYALDITNPAAPLLLWEFTPTSGIGIVTDNDLGYTYGQPVVTRNSAGNWVVLLTSGYDNGTLSGNPTVNNSPAGSGIGYLYVLNAATGAMISKISTGVGTAATPSGLAKIAGWDAEPEGNAVSDVYGGDLLGNVWRFNINSAAAATIGTGAVLKFATLFSDSAGANPQPVMTTPVLGNVKGKHVIFIGTGKYLETGDLTTTQKQTEYAIKDDNATSTLVNPRNTLVHQYLINNPDGTATRLSSGSSAVTATATNAVDFTSATGLGWYVDFPDSGERVNIDSQLVQGTLLVPTIVPSNTVCAPGGYGWLNYFDYTTGGSVTPLPGVPLASGKYDATIVGINVLYEQGQPVVEAVTSINPTPQIDTNPAFKPPVPQFQGKRVLWRELIQ